jgi:hypothetical protein
MGTPLVQGTSPAQQHQQPRSHPSPNATRTSAKTPISHPNATPINHPTASSTKTFGGTPMLQSLSQQGFGTASPSGAMGPNGTPSGMTGLGLGVDLLGTPGAMATTPSGMNMSMAMGMGMVPTMSELGLTLTASGGQKRNEDEERRAKMRRILKKIGRPRGRVSEEGICRVGRRVGFANDIDAEVLTAEERERKVGNRTVSIAGEAVVVDVDMKNHVPREVQVMLSGEGDGLVGLAEQAGEVLLASLRDTDNLVGFAKGLDWIAKIDRLGGGKVNGFEALGGIFGCLRRLCDEEIRLIQEGGVASSEQAEIVAMCKRSGRPSAHARGGLGIALDYWQDDRAVSSKRSDNDMEIDSTAVAAANTTPSGLHTLHLDLDRCPPEMYSPIRITSAWLPEKLTLEPNATIPWQEPDATFISPGDADDTMADNNLPNVQQKMLPSLRFLAKLDPPVVLPWQTATTLMTALGAVLPQPFSTPPLLHHVLLPTPTLGTGEIERQKTVLAYHSPDTETEAKHIYRLHVAKPDFGFKLEELPFAHPRQLVENLPTLRQWGCFGALVQDVFSGSPTNPSPLAAAAQGLSRSTATERQQTAGKETATPIDVSLATSPVPVLSLAFPALDGKRQISLEIAVGLNGDVSVSGFVGDVTGNGGEILDKAKARKWAKGLEVCGTVAVWIEWVRGEEAQ